MLAACLLPLLVAGFLLSLLWSEYLAQGARHARANELREAVRDRFTTPDSWQSESGFRDALRPLDWTQAYLLDADGARVWQQHRGNTPHRPSGTHQLDLRLSLSTDTDLVLAGASLRPAQRRELQWQFWSALALTLLAAGLIGGAAYRLAIRPWHRLRHWTRQLETGALTVPPPALPGPSGALAASIRILAQRLRFSRDTLQRQLKEAPDGESSQVQDLQRRHQALEREHAQLQTMLTTRSQFMSSMGHELRTPLTSILGFSDLLEKGDLTPEQADYVQTIRKSAKGLVGMINDLLDFGRLEAGRLEVHALGFEVSDRVEDTVALLAPLAYEKNLELISIVYHDVPHRLRGDPVRLQQILTNLLSNAIKFTSKGQVLLRVTKQSEDARTVRLNFSIEDSGVGLSADEQSRLFTAFERFEQSRPHQEGGSGLGLTIVQKLTELLDGDIQVESTPGKGSRFAVTLPFGAPAQPGPKSHWDGLRGLRCWVLEPHEMASRALHHLLEFWGMSSRRFESTAELTQTLANARSENLPQLVLLGLRADEIGEPQLGELLALENQPPMLALVNSVDVAVHRRLRERGVMAVLPKCTNRTSLYRSCCELSGRGAAETGGALYGHKILIVENNPASQHYLRALLESLDGEVLVADDGQAAFTCWQQEQPDLVLLDLQMPGMDGRETASAIREDDPASGVVLIGMSAFLSPEQEADWLDAGVNAILVKPFDESQLLRCIHPWLKSGTPRTTSPHAPRPARQLVDDPELAQMMAEELPRQLAELDGAFVDGNLEEARAAAHQLHGTAAFFHLAPLKEHFFLMEKRLRDIESIAGQTRLRDDMANVRRAVEKILLRLPNGSAPVAGHRA